MNLPVRKFLAAVREHTGLFVERAPRRYGFMHLTFEEYYVARHLVARSKTRAKLLRKHLHQPRWEEPILLALGFVGLEYPAEASELVETAILAEGEEANELGFTPSQYEDLLGLDYLFAMRCLGDNIPVHSRLMKRLIERFSDECLHGSGSARFQSYNKTLRERLAYLGGTQGANVLLPPLVATLHDAEARIRSNAAWSLGQLGQASPEVIAALVTALHDADANVRIAAAQNLGQLGQTSPEAIAALITALHDAEASVRSTAAQNLAKLGQAPPDAIAALVTTLHDADVNVRSSAAWSLGQLGQASPEAIVALVVALHDAYSNVRSTAAQSLGQLGQPSSEAIAALLAALHDADASVCFTAAQSLAQLGQASPEVTAGLLEGLRKAESWQIRRDSARFLGQIGQADAATLDTLWHGLLDDDDYDVRTACVQALARLGRRFPTIRQSLEVRFVEAIRDAKSDEPDKYGGHQAYDYAYDGLWLLVVGGELEKA